MIRWITDNLGTARISDRGASGYAVVDVRGLVDQGGNAGAAISAVIGRAVELLRKKQKVVICCDYGISRSNVIAAGVLAAAANETFSRALEMVMAKTGEKEINIEFLNSVRKLLEPRNTGRDHCAGAILVTGGRGFIGRALSAALKERYNPVIPSREDINLLTDSIKLDSLIKNAGVNLVIHLANPRRYTATGSLGQTLVMLKNVLDVCKENQCALLFPSSWVVYSGYNASRLIATESLPLRPRKTYGITKALCEDLIRRYREVYGLVVYLIRLSPTYGPGSDRPRFIHSFFQKALNNEPIITHRYQNSLPELDLIHIDDVVAALESLVEIRPSSSIDFNIGSGRSASTREIAGMIKQICGSESRIESDRIEDFVANIVMDISKAGKILNWKPKVNLKAGLEMMKRYIEDRER